MSDVALEEIAFAAAKPLPTRSRGQHGTKSGAVTKLTSVIRDNKLERVEQGLTMFPSSIFRDTVLLSGVRHIDFSRNHIGIIPTSVADFRALKVYHRLKSSPALPFPSLT